MEISVRGRCWLSSGAIDGQWDGERSPYPKPENYKQWSAWLRSPHYYYYVTFDVPSVVSTTYSLSLSVSVSLYHTLI